jgi:hypothetical protein
MAEDYLNFRKREICLEAKKEFVSLNSVMNFISSQCDKIKKNTFK